MITPYLIDEIDILKKSFDINGVLSTSTQTGIKARVEDYNKMIRDKKGQELMGDMLVITKVGEDIKNEDFILIKKKDGNTYYLSNKQFAIKKMENVSGFFGSHKEIYL